MNYDHVLSTTPTGRLRIWDHPREALDYVIGIDAAESKRRDVAQVRKTRTNDTGVRPDYCASVVIELLTGLHVATWHGYEPPNDFALINVALGRYYNNALLVPELNGPGAALTSALVETLRYDNVYRGVVVNMVDVDPLKQQFGFQTTGTSRKILMMRVHEAMSETRLWTRDGKLVRELRTMEFDNTGHERGRGNNKDDLVFALALALEGRFRALGDSGRPTDLPHNETPDRAYERRVWDHVKKMTQGDQHGVRTGSRDRVGLFLRRGTGGVRW